MENIQYVKIEGLLDVRGVYNYNGPEERNRFKNHMAAKHDNEGRDFTSSRCLRYEMFKDIQPRQPATDDFKNFFVSLVASEVGLLRGFLSPEDGAQRSSPLHIADAYTDEKYLFINNSKLGERTVLFMDQGVSSKPKESNKKNHKGDDISDNSLFSKDNAPPRKQIFIGAINIKELQFLSLDKKDSGFRMVSELQEDEFVLKLKEYFSTYNITDDIFIGEYKDLGSVLNVSRRGILLTQNQIRHLVRVSISRIKSINGLKSGASLRTDANSLKIIFGTGEEDFSKNTSDFLQKLPSITFKEFYKKVLL